MPPNCENCPDKPCLNNLYNEDGECWFLDNISRIQLQQIAQIQLIPDNSNYIFGSHQHISPES